METNTTSTTEVKLWKIELPPREQFSSHKDFFEHLVQRKAYETFLTCIGNETFETEEEFLLYPSWGLSDAVEAGALRETLYNITHSFGVAADNYLGWFNLMAELDIEYTLEPQMVLKEVMKELRQKLKNKISDAVSNFIYNYNDEFMDEQNVSEYV